MLAVETLFAKTFLILIVLIIFRMLMLILVMTILFLNLLLLLVGMRKIEFDVFINYPGIHVDLRKCLIYLLHFLRQISRHLVLGTMKKRFFRNSI